MFFNSFLFIAFLLLIITILFVERFVSKKVEIRNLTLLIASYFFYGYFNFGFVFILLYVTLVNYFLGKIVYKYKRKNTVFWCVILSLIPLIFFKYSLFLCRSFGAILNYQINLELLEGMILPVGISFFTFQALSYTIDLYRNKIDRTASLIEFMLFVAFFPTILSGPIEKARNLLPQIRRYFSPTLEDITQGFTIFIWGLFKKIVVADRLAYYVDWAYESAQYASGGTLLIAAIFYSIQIYCDFSGYSDMALGVAKYLGFNVTKNFRQPYFSRTFKEFWRKWHIALTSWFTEYVYFALGGSRVKSRLRWVFNISTIFLLSGIWHGAAWSFLVWGALHAIYYLTEHFLGLQKKELKWSKLKSALSGIAVFIFVTIAWIFFRLDFSSALFVLEKICSNSVLHLSMGASSFTFVGTCCMLLAFLIYELMIRHRILVYDVEGYNSKLFKNLISTIPLLVLLGMFGMSSDNFVYFQF